MRYLYGIANIIFKYDYSANNEFLGCCESNFVGYPDDRKSTTGFIFKLARAAATWQRKKQTTVANSTVEAE